MPTDGRLIDVNHEFKHGMITYKGLPAPMICDYLSREASRARYAPGTEFQIGKSLANLDCLVARVTARPEPVIDRLPFSAADVRGRAVLVQTGWDRFWRSDQYHDGHPYLTGELAE